MIKKQFKIDTLTGFAYPASLIVSIASKFKSDVSISYNGETVDLENSPHTILKLMSLGVKPGCYVDIYAIGCDERAALQMIEKTLCIAFRTLNLEEKEMTNNKKVWMITGAGRGMGVEFAKAALSEGYQVVATGRDPEKVAEILGDNENMLIVKLDVTEPEDVKMAVELAVDRFGQIDVLVNNAGSFYGGFFEELTPQQIERQISTNLYGPMNVTRAVLPVMRKNRSGHILSISSLAGLAGFEYNVAYCASKFGLEGFMESLHHDVAPYGIKTTIVEPGFFRTKFLEPESKFLAEASIDDYAERNAQYHAFWEEKNGKQEGDPVKLAKALITIVNQDEPPSRWIAGKDAIAGAEQKVAELQKQIDAYRELSTSLGYEE